MIHTVFYMWKGSSVYTKAGMVVVTKGVMVFDNQ